MKFLKNLLAVIFIVGAFMFTIYQFSKNSYLRGCQDEAVRLSDLSTKSYGPQVGDQLKEILFEDCEENLNNFKILGLLGF